MRDSASTTRTTPGTGSAVPASPFYGQSTYAGVYGGVTYTGQPFNQLPSMTVGANDPDVAFTNVSPRVGVNVDLTGSGHSVLKFYYARYVGQLGAGAVPGAGAIALVYAPVVLTYVRYPWVDLNGDRFIQGNEVVLTPVPLSSTSGYDYRNPSSATTSGTVDPKLSADHSDEIVVSVEQATGARFRGERELHLAAVRQLPLERQDQLDQHRLRAHRATSRPGARRGPGATP